MCVDAGLTVGPVSVSIVSDRKINHKYLASILGICCDSPQPYVIQEYLPGCTLKDLLKRQLSDASAEVLPWSRKLKIVRHDVNM